jgi:hypothetical protein
MSAFLVLREFLQARGSFTADELALVEKLFVPRTLRSGDFLQRTSSNSPPKRTGSATQRA